MTSETVAGPPKRPFALIAICALLALRGVLMLLLAVLALFGDTNQLELALLAGMGLRALGVIAAGLSVLDVIAAVGLWRLRPWAWRLTMILMGVLLLYGLWSHFADNVLLTNSLGLLLNIVIVFYLVQSDVRELFGAGEEVTPSV